MLNFSAVGLRLIFSFLELLWRGILLECDLVQYQQLSLGTRDLQAYVEERHIAW